MSKTASKSRLLVNGDLTGRIVGTSCSAQGIVHRLRFIFSQVFDLCLCLGSLRLIGEYASFFFIVAMGIHTFNTLALHKRPPHWLGVVVTTVGCVSAVMIGPSICTLLHLFILRYLNQVSFLWPRVMSMSHSTTSMASPATSRRRMELPTCFSTSYRCVSLTLVDHHVLMTQKLFLASFISVVVYSLIFLTLRGTIIFNDGLTIYINPERRLRPRNETYEEYQRFIYSVARTMLW